jgi:hypothetical protein
MTSLSTTYTDTHKDNLPAESRTRFGGPRPQLPTAMTFANNELYNTDRRGSHMPLDTGIHWQWNNPLNILPAIILFVLALALVALVFA